MSIREITRLRTNRFDQVQPDGTSVSQKFSHTDSTPLSGIETNESYDYTVTLNGDTTALLKIRLVGETSLDYQTSVNNSVYIISNHSSPYLNNPALTFYRGKTYRFIQTNANNASHPLVFTESDGTTSYTSGVSTNSGTAGTDLITTFTVPQNAPNTLKYVCSIHGATYGNTITVSDADTTAPKTKYAEIEVFHDEVESKILTDIGLSELILTPTRAYDSGTGTTDFTLNIENDFQDAFFFSIYTEGYTYDKTVSGYSGGGNTLTRLFGSRGVFGGGYNGATNVNTLDYITISTNVDATDFGDLTESRYDLAATSDGSRGVFVGGFVPPNSMVCTLDYITISTTGDATNFGDLTQKREELAATSDGSRGVFGGGNMAGKKNTIDYITISTPGNAIDFGDLTEPIEALAATSDGSRGVFGGGVSPTSNNIDYITYITISTPGNAIDFGDLNQSRYALAATSDGSRGVFGGGIAPPTVNTIDYITISTPGDATDFGDLTVSKRFLAATSDGSRGVFGGGYGGAYLNTIDYITISTPGNAIDFVDLTQGRYALAATSGD